MKLRGSKTENLSKTKKSILRMITLTIAVTATYELFYNFVVWNALSGIFRIDILNTSYPNPETPWSLIFATKMFLFATIISWYTFYMLSKPENK